MTTELAEALRRRIAATGPVTVAAFMAEALAHPTLGYYRRARAVGADGDFITAPEISQMFGELLGAWLAERWIAMGRPAPARLVELGPGRGTLMADALRATRGVDGFHDALRLHLVEIDATLREAQRAALERHRPVWHERLDDVPDDAPLLLVANEFLDALPTRQLVRAPFGWAERMVGLAPDGRFVFALAPGPSPLAPLVPADVAATARPGSVVEVSTAARALAAGIAGRLARRRGAALFIDYGYDAGTHGDTLQALRRHAKVDVFDSIGEADLTTHVDFAAVGASARAAGAVVDGPAGQGAFLEALGIATRAAALRRHASPAQAAGIDAAARRLIAPDQMGTLFRALALRDPATPPSPGFAAGADSSSSTPDGTET